MLSAETTDPCWGSSTDLHLENGPDSMLPGHMLDSLSIPRRRVYSSRTSDLTPDTTVTSVGITSTGSDTGTVGGCAGMDNNGSDCRYVNNQVLDSGSSSDDHSATGHSRLDQLTTVDITPTCLDTSTVGGSAGMVSNEGNNGGIQEETVRSNGLDSGGSPPDHVTAGGWDAGRAPGRVYSTTVLAFCTGTDVIFYEKRVGICTVPLMTEYHGDGYTEYHGDGYTDYHKGHTEYNGERHTEYNRSGYTKNNADRYTEYSGERHTECNRKQYTKYNGERHTEYHGDRCTKYNRDGCTEYHRDGHTVPRNAFIMVRPCLFTLHWEQIGEAFVLSIPLRAEEDRQYCYLPQSWTNIRRSSVIRPAARQIRDFILLSAQQLANKKLIGIYVEINYKYYFCKSYSLGKV